MPSRIMSVHHGRKQRQLLTPEKAMYRFRYSEGRAMSPGHTRHYVGRSIVALVLLAVSGGISTYGVFTREKNTMWTGFILLGMVFVWMMYQMSL